MHVLLNLPNGKANTGFIYCTFFSIFTKQLSDRYDPCAIFKEEEEEVVTTNLEKEAKKKKEEKIST